MDYTLAALDSKALETMYIDLDKREWLTDDDRDRMQDILGVLNRRGWRIKL